MAPDGQYHTIQRELSTVHYYMSNSTAMYSTVVTVQYSTVRRASERPVHTLRADIRYRTLHCSTRTSWWHSLIRPRRDRCRTTFVFSFSFAFSPAYSPIETSSSTFVSRRLCSSGWATGPLADWSGTSPHSPVHCEALQVPHLQRNDLTDTCGEGTPTQKARPGG